MNKIIVLLVAVVVLGIGGFFVWNITSGSSSNSEQVMMDDRKDSMMTEDKAMEDDTMMMEKSSYGAVISGSASPFVEFNQDGYEKAIADGKIVFLDFYADWCPICRAEAPIIDSGFNSLTSDQVVGFRVNFKDSNTDEDETKLAEEFNIPYQHTKLILVNGKEADRYPDQWDQSDFDSAFSKVL